MNASIGLMFLQGYVATPRALAAVAPDLVDQVADAIEQNRGTPSPKRAAAAADSGLDGSCAIAC